MSEIRLPLPAYAYRFELLLEFARRIEHPARLLVAGDALWRFSAGQLLSYRQEGDAIVVRGAGIAPDERARIVQVSRHCLGLGQDLSAFYERAKADSRLWRVIKPLAGLPIHCAETVFEALITLIIEQHITWKNAMRAQRFLLRLCGDEAATGAGAVYDFPTPMRLARAALGEFKPMKITNKRIDLIINVAAAVCSGELDLERLRALPPERASAKLLELKGVGPWTANNVVGRACGRYPEISSGDVALQAAVRRYFHDDRGEKGAQQVCDALERFGEHAGMAGHFVLLRWVMDNYAPVAR